METIRKLDRSLFILALLVFFFLGCVVVGLQIFGLVTLNGNLMVFASKKIYPVAVLGSTIAGFLSFIFPYTEKKEKVKKE